MEYFGDSNSIYNDMEDTSDMDDGESMERRQEEMKTCRNSRGDRHEIGRESLIFINNQCIQRTCREENNKAKWDYQVSNQCTLTGKHQQVIINK